MWGIILLIIGAIMLFSPIFDKLMDFEGYSLKQTKDLCDSWVGGVNKAINKDSRKYCGTVDFLYYFSFVLVIIGLVLLLIALINIDKKRIKKSLFMKSLKQLDKRLLVHMVMFDALFYLALFGILVLAFTSLSWNFNAVKEAIPVLDSVVGDIDSGEMSEDVTEKLTELNVLFFIAIARTLLILLIIFIVSLMVGIFFKGLIWSRILHKKFDVHFYRRFTLFNLIWIIPWSLLIVILLFAIRTKIVFWYILAVIIIFLHFTNIIYVLFEKEKKFLKILKDTFIVGIEDIHCFLIPYLLIALIFFALVYILGLFSFLPWQIHVIFFILVLLIYFAWVRIYVSNIILDKIS